MEQLLGAIWGSAGSCPKTLRHAAEVKEPTTKLPARPTVSVVTGQFCFDHVSHTPITEANSELRAKLGMANNLWLVNNVAEQAMRRDEGSNTLETSSSEDTDFSH